MGRSWIPRGPSVLTTVLIKGGWGRQRQRLERFEEGAPSQGKVKITSAFKSPEDRSPANALT